MKCNCEEMVQNDESLSTGKCIKDLLIFQNLSKKQIEGLQTIGLRKSIKKGTSVFLQGDPGIEMFFIKSGRIKLCRVNEGGSEVILGFRKAGDVIGENMFTVQEEYPLSAWALEDSITCGFNMDRFKTLVLTHPDFGLKVIQSMSAKMAFMTNHIESLAENNLADRLYSVLTNIAKEHGTKVKDGYAIDFPITHEQLAFLIGAHRVSITKAMRFLGRCGKVIKRNKKLRLIQYFP